MRTAEAVLLDLSPFSISPAPLTLSGDKAWMAFLKTILHCDPVPQLLNQERNSVSLKTDAGKVKMAPQGKG